ncbi:unnamed protein product [Albugo candida]|uniref:Uncharacterized protein n=1 Tax=Albugo candida TaxID=65357 RepID=A0A024FTW7_9STRA|nr:unnamed protein product [Albugo candida]|eukprot:CCI10583.1 unnamed protein product [Albugo candida]
MPDIVCHDGAGRTYVNFDLDQVASENRFCQSPIVIHVMLHLSRTLTHCWARIRKKAIFMDGAFQTAIKLHGLEYACKQYLRQIPGITLRYRKNGSMKAQEIKVN